MTTKSPKIKSTNISEEHRFYDTLLKDVFFLEF